uniref:Protein kinase domain-containing protein n=1 Tax=Salix viminalis TaxID=40686 RepID=A0A6N2M0H2_SALVM
MEWLNSYTNIFALSEGIKRAFKQSPEEVPGEFRLNGGIATRLFLSPSSASASITTRSDLYISATAISQHQPIQGRDVILAEAFIYPNNPLMSCFSLFFKKEVSRATHTIDVEDEGNHRILVYGYLENNSLAQTLLGGGGHSNIQFSWPTRRKICIGVARGLAFLHEEVQPHVVHRDIKASNVLLDNDLEPRISDFGLAKLFPANLTHISTNVAGTAGYLAPEYAIRGQLTRKADIYSFGVLLLEIVSGRTNTNRRLPPEEQLRSHWLRLVWEFYQKQELVNLVDTSLAGNYDVEEACNYLKIGLLCTQDVPKQRPSMSTVVLMLMGEIEAWHAVMSFKGDKMRKHGDEKDQNNKWEMKDSGKGESSSSSLGLAETSNATMTFSSIYDRDN